MSPIIIWLNTQVGESGFYVKYEGKICDCLTFDEMLGMIVSIAYPAARGRNPEPFYRLRYQFEIDDFNRLHGLKEFPPLLIPERCTS